MADDFVVARLRDHCRVVLLMLLLVAQLLLAIDQLHSLLASPLLQLTLESGVVVVFDVVVCASG